MIEIYYSLGRLLAAVTSSLVLAAVFIVFSLVAASWSGPPLLISQALLESARRSPPLAAWTLALPGAPDLAEALARASAQLAGQVRRTSGSSATRRHASRQDPGPEIALETSILTRPLA